MSDDTEALEAWLESRQNEAQQRYIRFLPVYLCAPNAGDVRYRELLTPENPDYISTRGIRESGILLGIRLEHTREQKVYHWNTRGLEYMAFGPGSTFRDRLYRPSLVCVIERVVGIAERDATYFGVDEQWNPAPEVADP